MKKMYYIGLEIAKNVFQIFLADRKGWELDNRHQTRKQLMLILPIFRLQARGKADTTYSYERAGDGHRLRLSN